MCDARRGAFQRLGRLNVVFKRKWRTNTVHHTSSMCNPNSTTVCFMMLGPELFSAVARSATPLQQFGTLYQRI